MSNYSEFGLKVRSALLQREVTMTTLARKVGITPAYLSEILKGTRGKRTGEKYKSKIYEILGITE